MADRRDTGQGLRGSVRRAVGGALDATVGRVGDAVGEVALDVTGATAQQVIEELEPYLIEEAIPRIVDGITPYLADSVVPEVLESIQGHLVEVTVPEVVDGVTAHLVAVTVPEVVSGVTPRLVEDLLPRLLTDLRPFLVDELVPRIVEGLVPEITTSVAPDLIEALMPKIEAEVAPRLVEALMPTIERDLAPRVVDAVLPKIRGEVVPTILDDIVDDPRVRDLIREQSQGLFLDAFEALRENLADGDDIVENVIRRVLRRPPRALSQSALSIVVDATSTGEAATRRTLGELEAQRAAWQAAPVPPAPPGREFPFAGVVTRGIALLIDVSLTGWLISQGLSSLVGLLDSILSPIPGWLAATLTALSVNLVPLYLAVSWSWLGRSIGSWLVGVRICTPDGRRLGLVRSAVRAWLLVFGIVIWVSTGFVALFDARRRTLLDMLVHAEERYLVPDNQQRRYVREAVLARRRDAAPAAQPPAPDPVPPEPDAAEGDRGL